MRKIAYNGSSKIISRIVELLNKKAPLPENGEGVVQWGTSGQVLVTDGQGATSWQDQSGGSEVVVTPTLQSGTKVADVSVDGTAQSIYAPTPPTKLSDLTNDTGFITNTVNNLTNYYLSSNTYTKTEVDSLISAIVTLNVLVVQSLPVSDISTTTIYLVPKSTPDTQDVYDEYINLDGTSSGWEHIGSTQIDLSNYYTKTEINALLSAKANTADLATVATSGDYSDLSNTPTIPTATSDLTNDSNFVSDASYVHTDNNYTSTEKTKLGGIAAGAEVNVQADWNETDNTSDAYIANKPSIPAAQIQSDWTQSNSSSVDFIKNKPSIPTKTSDLTNDSDFVEGSDLATVATSGSYTDLSNTPTIPAAQIQSDWAQSDSTAVDFIKNKPTIPSSSGHTIWNAIKTALTQRTKLWFADAKVTDDTTEQATKVEVVQLIDDEDELDDAPDGVYQGDYDDAPKDILDASMVAYGNGNVEDALDGFIVENKTVWSNLTLAADSSTAIQVSDISKSGYTPIGIVGYSFDGSYGNCLSYSKLTVIGNTLKYLVANNGNSSASSINCVVQILYKKAKQ